MKKLAKIKNKIKKHFTRIAKNYRYEVRYKNLLKKYEELESAIEVLKKQLDIDENLKKIENLELQVKRKNNIINNLRKDIKTYDEKMRGEKKRTYF